MLEWPASETCTQSHGDMIIMSGKADKQRKLLATVNVSLPLGARQIMWLFKVLHGEMQTAKMLGFILR